MPPASENRRGFRFALHRLFSRVFRPTKSDDPFIAAPDSLWEGSDHHPSPVEDDRILDPWDPESYTGSTVILPVSEASSENPGLHSESSTAASNPIFEHIGFGEGDGETVTGDVGTDPELPRLGLNAETFGRLDPRCETDNVEDWDALRDGEEGLVNIQDKVEGLAANWLPEGSEEQIVDVAEEEIADTITPIEWTEPTTGETLDSDWEDEASPAYSFDALDVSHNQTANAYIDLGLADYDEDARQRPWELEPDEEDEAIRRARQRAATITSLLGLPSVARRNAALGFLTVLFEHLPHPATYRALRNLAEDGLDFETLQAVVNFRRVWTQRTDWWLYRYRGEVCCLRNGAAALTWILAHRVCLARWQFSPETMIDEEWLDEWLALPPGSPGYPSFPQFIAEKVDGLVAETLYAGLISNERSGSLDDLNDNHDWYLQVSDRYGVIGQGFSIITPYDDRPGVIRPGRRDEKEGD